jgi:hypothetical protein
MELKDSIFNLKEKTQVGPNLVLKSLLRGKSLYGKGKPKQMEMTA